MRLLLIDNHDSFSAILHHYLWELAGERPLFFRNDELSRDELEALDFDAAVLSPGPGHPANVRDFGVCRDLLELFPRRPVLGVCLGMQGMAHFAGGTVAPWPGARHGRPSRIAHDGTGLFRGLPPEFTAIRYHSLIVDPESLPGNVAVTARSVEDDCVMGVSFADRPWSGIQFHPESIGTQHGMKLLGNFLDLAKPDRAGPVTSSREENPDRAGHGEPAPPAFAGAGSQAGVPPAIPFVELPWRDPAETFVRFLKGASAAFWLDGEHSRPEAGWPTTVMGRSDLLYELGEGSIQARSFDARTGGWNATPLAGDPSAISFRRILGEPRAPRDCPWAGYRGGPIGQFDYEWNPHAAVTPPMVEVWFDTLVGRWMVPEGWLVFDPAARRVFAAWEGREPPAWLQAAIEAWNEPAPAAPPQAALPPFGEWEPLLTEAEHAASVAALQESIARGDTYEACLTHDYSVKSDADPLGVFLRLRAHNPAPYAAYLAFPYVRLLSASPELFLEGSASGMLRSRPIKGTRRRGADPDSDWALRDELTHSEKDAAENRMITDLTRHDLARVCLPGSVEVPEFLRIEEHPAVFQLVSEVRGRMAPGVDAWDAIAACFPGGSMTGAPKERTMEILKSLETAPRGIYSGALGYLTDGGAFILSMVIRTLVDDGFEWRTGCGGAVLIDSDPAAEWREATVKARSVIDAAAGQNENREAS